MGKRKSKATGRLEPGLFLAGILLLASAAPLNAQQAAETASMAFAAGPGGDFVSIEIGAGAAPSIGDAMEMAGDPAAMAQLAGQMMSSDLEDSTVMILVPDLDYGMTGTFTNLRIESGEGVSITPTGRLGSPYSRNRDQYTGTLTITEFTRTVMVGSYSADLYHMEWSSGTGPTRRREFVRRVSGQFMIGMPLFDDTRHEAWIPPSEEARQLVSAQWDALRMIGFGIATDTDFSDPGALLEETLRPVEPGASDPAGSGSGIGSIGDCQCNCETILALPYDDDCRLECELAGLTCPAAGASAPYTADELMRILQEKGVPPETQAMMLQMLATMSRDQQDQILDSYRTSY